MQGGMYPFEPQCVLPPAYSLRIQVCRLFNSVVADNAQLQYKIDLFFARFENGSHCNLDTVGRLRALRQYQQAWNNLLFPNSGLISMQEGHTWELSGGVLCQAMRSKLTCVQLPCKIKGIPEREWTVTDLGFDIRDFGIDTSQDLIVAVEQVGVMYVFLLVVCVVHFTGV